jgi:hypothetical protein
MAIVDRFDTPGRLDELSENHRLAWSEKVVASKFKHFSRRFPQFYNPAVEDTPAGLMPELIEWSAFPVRVVAEVGRGAASWDRADSSRLAQDEYCEWSVERGDDGKITRITFTTEVPEYWEHVAQHDRNLLLKLYRQFVDPNVELDELFDGEGKYDRLNQWNRSTEGRLAHLMNPASTLGAAIRLVAEATILRVRDGKLVTDRQDLVVCGGLGDELRNSDPQIAEIVNGAAKAGSEITLLNPVGLYLDGRSAGMETPDGVDAAEFWEVERGAPGHAVRASFAVPEDRDYVVGDIKVDGLPITFGAQVADKVRVRIAAVVKPGDHQPDPLPCGVQVGR